ncbi:MAG: hypothetical protein KF768_12910 [Phycisphaeraceae bacterium]|nr:hypothetical protein [Phycisphaeraceae bacterium]
MLTNHARAQTVRLIILLMVSVPLLFHLGGCFIVPHTTRGIYLDARDDQPFERTANPAAPARVSMRVHGKEAYKFLEWLSGRGDWIDSRDIVRQSVRHLERAGAERRAFTQDLALIDLVFRTPRGSVSPNNSVIEPIWTIVSLDPLILVESQGTIQGTMHSYWHVSAQPDDSSRQPGALTKANVFLNGGFHYGLNVPDTPEPRWTSPQAGDRIFVSREVSPTERAIDHPTRPLRLVRDGSSWRVELAQQP